MPSIYQTDINEIDRSAFRVARGAVIAVVGPAAKGPFLTSVLLRSEQELERTFGLEIAGFYAVAVARQILRAGGRVRFSRTVHQTTAATWSTRTSAAAEATLVDRAGTPLDTLRVYAKHEGTWANGVTVTIAAATSGASAKFKITIASPGLGIPQAIFDEVTMAGVEALTSDHWGFENLDSATVSPNNMPALGSSTLTGGANGTTDITDAEELGNSQTLTGIYALAGNDDFIDVFAPDCDASATHVLFKTWAESVFVVAHLTAPSTVDASNIEAFREKTGSFSGGTVIDSSYCSLHFGQLQFNEAGNPSAAIANYPNAGGMGGVLAQNDSVSFDDQQGLPGPWKIPSGSKRGRTQALGVVVDISASQTLKNTLSEIGVNWFELEAGVVIARGNRTLAYATTLLRYLHVRRMLLRLRRDISPVLRANYDEPNTPILWRRSYREVTKILREYQANRGLIDFRVECDQNAKDADEAVLNTPEIVAQGIFKMILRLKPQPGVESIAIDIVVDGTGVSYTELAA